MWESPSKVKFNIGINMVYLNSGFVKYKKSVGFCMFPSYPGSLVSGFWFLLQFCNHNSYLTCARLLGIWVFFTKPPHPVALCVL